jgi:hypothetical protein
MELVAMALGRMRRRLEFVAATAMRGWRRRANFCDASFF